MNSPRRIQRVMLTQPNFSWFGRRTWKLIPYNLGLLNASLKNGSYDSWIFDPNFLDLSEQAVREEIRRTQPDVVGITTFSSEYMQEPRRLSQIVKEELPQCLVILGGILPTILLDKVLEDANIDYFVIGEGEYRLPRLLDKLNSDRDLSGIDGLAYGQPVVVQPMREFISHLDALSFPDYGGVSFSEYSHYVHRYNHPILPRQFPFAITSTSRGCPYKCIFCSAGKISGQRVRFRSASNVLQEIEELHNDFGVREIIFTDDHFLADRDRAIQIMKGLIDQNYGINWKCCNVAIWCLDGELLEWMKRSGCYQLTVSIESGNQRTLKEIIKKPVNLDNVPAILERAQKLGLQIAANFVFGFPGESWDQIRDTCRYAEKIQVDITNFHIATPLPGTELMEICRQKGYLKSDDGGELFGYTQGVIETPDFTSTEIQILRAFEWDRINFSTPERKLLVAQMEGISLEELEKWRSRTRHNLGRTIGWKE